MKSDDLNLTPESILDALNDGVYVTDTDRRIIYWSRSAERITGWQDSDILGKRCCDDVLSHVDKDGHRLCGEEYCPLYRAMITGRGSTVPVVVFAQCKDRRRIPMRVSVAPIRDGSGQVVGGVESFRDVTSEIGDLSRAKKIQATALREEPPGDDRISFSTHYIPHDVVGGDYYAITKLDADRYAFLLADVAGHGVAAALYTMHLSALWAARRDIAASPCRMAAALNQSLCKVIGQDESFATGMCGAIDLADGALRVAGAGGPHGVLVRQGGGYESIDCAGLPLGFMEDADHAEQTVQIGRGDCLLFFTDGAVEIRDAAGNYLQADGVVRILKRLGYPGPAADFKTIEEEMLKYSDRIRFDDDLTFLEIRLS